MNLDIKFDNAAMAKEFAEMLRDENVRGLRINQEHKTAENGALAAPELMEIITLAVNPVVLGAASTLIIGALKIFFNFKIKEKEEKIKEAERNVEIETSQEEIASKERIEMAKIALEREKIAIEMLKVQSQQTISSWT